MSTYAGWEGEVKIGTSLSAMRSSSAISWESLDADVKNNLKRIFTGGQRDPEEIKEGLLEISAKIARKWRDKTTLSDKAGVGSTGALTEYYIGIYPEGYSSGNTEYYVVGKFDSYKLSLKHDDITREEADFIAKSITVGTVP
ncbi:MAG: hypothetical protein DRJ60_01140 [Thermoprotei archaeon]|nr:MAG: hypothetical protein DRJ60_01140 [Thermoprotei archaeon]